MCSTRLRVRKRVGAGTAHRALCRPHAPPPPPFSACGAMLWRLLSPGGGGHVYVCGATRMGQDVQRSFESVFAADGGLTGEAAAAMVKSMVAGGRYVQELWS